MSDRPSRPEPLECKPENAPEELKERDQWICWRVKWDSGREEWTKVPVDPNTGGFAKSTDESTWASFEGALEYHEQEGSGTDGLGFVFAAGDLVMGVDLDDCRDVETGDVLEEARDIVDDLDSFTEVSPSGTGFHVFVFGLVPDGGNRGDLEAEGAHLEMYDSGRFFTFTGHRVDVTPPSVEQRADAVKDIHSTYIKDDDESESEEVADAEPVDLEDSDLIEKAKNAENGDDFERLWRGDTSMHSGDHSRADLALCGHLAFWTGGDRQRIDRLFRSSGLMRGKWDEDRGAQTYGERTIEKALEARTDFYDPNSGAKAPSDTDNEPVEKPPEPENLDDDPDTKWEYVRDLYGSDEGFKKDARLYAADALEEETAYMFVLETEKLWVYEDDSGYFVPGGEARVQRVLEEKLGSHYSISEKNEITDRIRARNQTHREDLNAKDYDEPLLCVGNGVVDFATSELLPHDPKYKFTRGIRFDYPVDGGDPQPVVEFLGGITKREEDWKTIIDHLAHGLMPGHPYRAFVITYGPGGNGKTQLGELLRGFVGEDNAAAVELQDLTGDDDFATGALPSAFINVGDDVSVAEIRNTSTLKTATGGGTLRANEKFEKKFDFRNEAAMFFSANEPPRIAEDKQSIDDRLYPIEMPYRHVDQPDPENTYERKKVPGISDKLLDDERAMEGLLALAVEHGKRLIETDGQYSMPEGPAGRREIYEAASDPIRRFALEFLEDAGGSDVVLKDDAYTVYTILCDRDDERPAREDTFKTKISQQSIVDVESGQTRQLTPGDDRVPCWKYVRFNEDAKTVMPPRLIERYFPGADGHEPVEEDSGQGMEPERAAFGAEPIRDAAKSLTGYVTVTAEVVNTHRLGETGSGLKAVLKDATGAMDVVSWDVATIDDLERAEGQCVALQNAEVSEYDGSHQLTVVDGLTTVKEIQHGAGYTEHAPGEDDGDLEGTVQGGLDELKGGETSTDGGEYIQLEPDILEELRTEGDGSIAELAGRLGESPAEVQSAVESLGADGRVIIDGEGAAANVTLNN